MAMSEAKGFGEQLCKRLRAARERSGRRQEDVADDMRSLGYQWTKATVASVELGRRCVDREELHTLALVLDTSLLELEDFDFASPGGAVITREMMRASTTGESPDDQTWLIIPAKDWPNDAEIKASARLGITTERLQKLASLVWGRSLSEERERRLGDVDDLPRRTVQARRGHITRQLLAELVAQEGIETGEVS